MSEVDDGVRGERGGVMGGECGSSDKFRSRGEDGVREGREEEE